MEITYNAVYPGPIWLGLLILFCVYTVMRGRPEWAVGMFFAISGWNRNLWFGPFVHTYVVLAVIYLAACVDVQSRLARGERVELLPRHDKPILIFILCWWLWQILLLQLFDAWNMPAIRRNLVLLIIVALPPILVFANNVRRLAGFATAYTATTIAGGWIALAAHDIPLTALLTDPGLNSYGLTNLGVANYHAIAWTFGCALILTMAQYLQSRTLHAQLFLLGTAALLTQFLLLSLSRQSMAGAVICVVIFGIWALFSRNTSKPRVVTMVTGVILLVIAVYQIAPHLVVRQDEAGLLQAFDLVGERSVYWQTGWQAFVNSPLWGSGFTTPYSHNLALGTMAEQGLVGLFFLLGYFYFVLRQARAIVSDRGDDERAVWRVAFFLVVIFFVIHSMASGTTTNGRHLYWAGILLWFQSELVHPARAPHVPMPTRLVAPRPPRLLRGSASD